MSEGRINLFVNLVDDLGGRALRRDKAAPRRNLVARYELTDRRPQSPHRSAKSKRARYAAHPFIERIASGRQRCLVSCTIR
jgi:hypothetical protein